MNYDFVEIGTSDFQTLLQTTDDGVVGISIDAIQLYLDRLPERKNKQKLNYAISDKEGVVDVFWVHPAHIDDVATYNLPYWLKGCNTIISPHPTTVKELEKRNLQHLLQKTQCECISWNTLIERHNIQHVAHLKIDTEGHDCVILKSVLSSNLIPDVITFEVNELTDTQLLAKVYEKLNELGFNKVNTFECDVTYTR
jgi:FkbM family methyltransferase